ncbi:hypothetical protein K438DRAFT_1782610 [Mycena galopus ATCC 62051]|nr:hypothetical protein K438DRAFT_1782610 [Mycena galopus ATCC 62051]
MAVPTPAFWPVRGFQTRTCSQLQCIVMDNVSQGVRFYQAPPCRIGWFARIADWTLASIKRLAQEQNVPQQRITSVLYAPWLDKTYCVRPGAKRVRRSYGAQSASRCLAHHRKGRVRVCVWMRAHLSQSASGASACGVDPAHKSIHVFTNLFLSLALASLAWYRFTRCIPQGRDVWLAPGCKAGRGSYRALPACKSRVEMYSSHFRARASRRRSSMRHWLRLRALVPELRRRGSAGAGKAAKACGAAELCASGAGDADADGDGNGDGGG